MSAAQRASLSRGLALLVAGTFFMENFDGTILATAAPRLARSLHVAPVDINLAMIGYLLALAIFIPASAWVADRFGGRRVFAVAIVVFTLASGACALSTSLPMLVATRVVQGTGGAMMVPVGRLVVLRTAAVSERITALAYLTWPGLVAPLLAPEVGGLIVDHASWRLIFVINLPLGLIALSLVPRIVPALGPREVPPLDWSGLLLSTAAIAALVVGLEDVGAGGSAFAAAVPCLGAAALLGTLAVRHLRRASQPLVDLGVLRLRTMRASVFGGSWFRLTIQAVPFLLPLTFQVAWGWSAVKSGAVLLALFVGNFGIKPVTTVMLHRIGFRMVLVLSVVGSFVALVAIAATGPRTPLPLLLALLVVSGVFRSVGFTSYSTVAFAEVDHSSMNDANVVFATAVQLSAGLGVALGALAVHIGGPLSRAVVPGASLVAGYRTAILLCAAVLLVPLAELRRLPRDAGHELTAGPPVRRVTLPR